MQEPLGVRPIWGKSQDPMHKGRISEKELRGEGFGWTSRGNETVGQPQRKEKRLTEKKRNLISKK